MNSQPEELFKRNFPEINHLLIKCLEPKKRLYTLVLEDRLLVSTLLSTIQTTGVQIIKWHDVLTHASRYGTNRIFGGVQAESV
jgi:hypothetical protein